MQASVLALGTLLLLAPLQQARDQAPPQTGTGRIAGTVVGAESGRAVRFAEVLLISDTGEQSAVTDDGGAFSFDRLPPGAYTLRVNKPGYLDMVYGQARPGTETQGKPIVLSERGQSKNVVVPLSQGGSISGVIRDDRGDPAFQATVTVSRWMTAYGIRRLEMVDSATTDERGRYRLSLLPPRDYLLSVMPSEQGLPDTRSGPHPFGFAPIFHPAAPSAQSAEPIRLGLGEERTNLDLQLPLVPLGRVTGVVVDANGRPAGGVFVSLDLRESGLLDDAGLGTRTESDGRFTFEKVVPGAYSATASTLPHDNVMKMSFHKFQVRGAIEVFKEVTTGSYKAVEAEVDSSPTTHAPGSASGEVSVSGGTVASVTLTLEPPRTVAGHLVFEGPSSKPPLKGIQVELVSIRSHGGPESVSVADDGTFEVPGVVPGRYALTVNVGAPWNVASAISGGVEVLDAFLDVPRERDVRDVTITLRDRGTELTGTVMDAAGRATGERTVIVFAAEERLWAGTSRVQAHHLFADGLFSFNELRPGRYLMAVVDGVENGEWLDPAFLRQLVPGAVAVTLGDGERKVQDLRVR